MCVRRYTEYLALSIQRKGITYYRRLPARRALIYCYPVYTYISLSRAAKRERPPAASPSFPATTIVLRRSAHRVRKIIVRFNNVSFRPLSPPFTACHDARHCVSRLTKCGSDGVVLTGDRQRNADENASKSGTSNVRSTSRFVSVLHIQRLFAILFCLSYVYYKTRL